jgi:hypothetical protein
VIGSRGDLWQAGISTGGMSPGHSGLNQRKFARPNELNCHFGSRVLASRDLINQRRRSRRSRPDLAVVKGCLLLSQGAWERPRTSVAMSAKGTRTPRERGGKAPGRRPMISTTGGGTWHSSSLRRFVELTS